LLQDKPKKVKVNRRIGKFDSEGRSLKRPHRCTIEDCRKTYRNIVTLEAHMRTHEGAGVSLKNKLVEKKDLFLFINYFQSVICDICEKPLSSIRNMLRHKKTHRSVDERSIKCTLCYKILVNEFSLQNHMRSHANIRSHVCDICGLSFVAKSSLNVS
jgi:uncharacterized Zn-finger protein